MNLVKSCCANKNTQQDRVMWDGEIRLSRPFTSADIGAVWHCIPGPDAGFIRKSISYDAAVYEPVLKWHAEDHRIYKSG